MPSVKSLMKEYEPEKYNDEELQDIFLRIDRDLVPERYRQVCEEMEKRGIPYEDLCQANREHIRLDQELEVMSAASDHFRSIYYYIVGGLAFLTYIYNAFIK